MNKKESIARYNAQDLICDKCIYIGQIKDGRESFYCDVVSSTAMYSKK